MFTFFTSDNVVVKEIEKSRDRSAVCNCFIVFARRRKSSDF